MDEERVANSCEAEDSFTEWAIYFEFERFTQLLRTLHSLCLT